MRFTYIPSILNWYNLWERQLLYFSLFYYPASIVSVGFLLLVLMETGSGNKNSGQFNVLTHLTTHCNYVTTQQLALYEWWIHMDFCVLSAEKIHSMHQRPFKGSMVCLWLCFRLALSWSWCFCKHTYSSVVLACDRSQATQQQNHDIIMVLQLHLILPYIFKSNLFCTPWVQNEVAKIRSIKTYTTEPQDFDA